MSVLQFEIVHKKRNLYSNCCKNWVIILILLILNESIKKTVAETNIESVPSLLTTTTPYTVLDVANATLQHNIERITPKSIIHSWNNVRLPSTTKILTHERKWILIISHHLMQKNALPESEHFTIFSLSISKRNFTFIPSLNWMK